MLQDLSEILKGIRLIIFDVDGVLTDGRLYYGEKGECFKSFNAKDGLGISRLVKNGYEVAIITGRESVFVTQRALDLGIQHVFQGKLEKLSVFKGLIHQLKISPKQVAYMGDDFIDMPVMQEVACAACPSDAMPYVKEICNFVAQRKGGCGAARELCDAIWMAQHSCDIWG